MTHRLFWKLCFILATGTVALFYVINILTSQAEEGMSYISLDDRQQIQAWGEEAERLFLSGNENALSEWLQTLKEQEQTWVAVVETDLRGIAGSKVHESIIDGVLLGRDINWKIHLYFTDNPIMEVTFTDQKTRFLIQLPDRMRPGSYFVYMSIALQIILPMTLLIPLTIILYQHIMSPLRQLQRATGNFGKGDFDVRVSQMLGSRNDELAELANTFDQMAAHIGDLINSQRQLINDLSHELRTPLTRLDIAVESLNTEEHSQENIDRVNRESRHIRKLVDDTLTLAWLDNERPRLEQEKLDLVDLLDVLIADAEFEFPEKRIRAELPESAIIENSSHRAAGQALENVLRNALLYTPDNQEVSIKLTERDMDYLISICDQGPGVPDAHLQDIFQPFFRIDDSRESSGGFGLGLALAKRQLETIRGRITAKNREKGGLLMAITLPK